MSKCNTCEHSGGCKNEVAFRQFEKVVGSDCNCSGFKLEEDKTSLYEDIKEGLRQALAYERNTWVISENGCVITCPNCRTRLELCYPDGTEVRYLPHCPWCGKKLKENKNDL